MLIPDIDLGKVQHFLLELEGIILNIILFVQMCIKHIRKG
jgi:hypothetical protein